ncbi:hypothetical protein D1872_309630 [compost metagenome]
MIVPDVDIGMPAHLLRQSPDNLIPCGIAVGVQNPAVAVRAFFRQGKLPVLEVERRSERH